MAEEFKLPELGENIEGGDVVGILVSAGDEISPDTDVLELETDKATVTVPSSVGGVIKEIHISEGDHVEVGQVIFTVDDANGGASDNGKSAPQKETRKEPEPEQAATEAEEESEVEFKIPDLGENIEGGDVVGVLISEGDTIKTDQDVLELETDKATLTVPSSVGGTVTKIHVSEGDHVEVGQVVFTLSSSEAPKKKKTAPKKEAPQSKEPAPSEVVAATPHAVTPGPTARGTSVATKPELGQIPAAPNVRRLARELGIDISEVPPGDTGRVTVNDLKAYSREIHSTETKAAPAAPSGGAARPSKPLPDFSKYGEVEREKMGGIRRATAKQMDYAWTTAPRVTQFDSAAIDELEGMRKKYNKKLEKSGTKLTVTAILLKVVSAALKKFPKFNASVDMENEEVIYKKYFNIGVAVDTPNGLLVPVIKDVERKNIVELADELNELAGKARDRKLGNEDMQGGNFTISNLGGIGGTNFTPIVNAPEVAILGVSRGKVEPVYRDGEFHPTLMMPLALSYDHRLIDGAEAARFLRWIVQALEDPLMMSLQAW